MASPFRIVIGHTFHSRLRRAVSCPKRNLSSVVALIHIKMRLDVSVPVMQSRRVVVHYHIFKNGGTTIESILEREFSGRFATLHGNGSDAVLDARDLLEFLRRHPGKLVELAALLGHESLDTTAVYIRTSAEDQTVDVEEGGE